MEKMLKRSPHFGQHVKNHPKGLFDFAGWEMPTHFSSLEEESHACRHSAILFDGHAMGELHITGKDALKAVQKLCANDISRAVPGQCIYSSLCTEEGGIFDDLVVFCITPEHYVLTVAAANVSKSPQWCSAHTSGMDVCVTDLSSGTTCIEIQGPKSREILQKVAEFDVSNEALPYYRFANGKIAGIECMVARLGVTGELGYEIFYDPGYAYTMYDALLKAGKDSDMALCGNATIGMFRLEKVYHIYNREISEKTNPFEAGLGWAVKLDKGDFVGRAALEKIKNKGVDRKLVGFVVDGGQTSIPAKSIIAVDGKDVGFVTFGSFSPTLKKTIGLGYIPQEHASLGNKLTIVIGAEKVGAVIVETPFYDPKGTRIRV